MNIVTEKQSLLNLWLESFVIINNSLGKLIKALLALLLLMGAVIAVCAFTFGMFSPLTRLLTTPFSAFCTTVILQVIAAYILQTPRPVTEIFTSSVWPTIFQLLSSLLLGICCVPVALICALFLKISPVLGCLLLIAWAFLAVRFLYSFIAIAIDNKGPVEGLIYSWKLTSGKNYIDVLQVLLVLIGSYALLILFYTLLAIALWKMIPLYFANSFDLANLSPLWWIFGLMLLLIYLFYHLAMVTFLVLVFLNRKFQQEPLQTSKEQDAIFISLPELEISNQEDAQQPSLSGDAPQTVSVDDSQKPSKAEKVDNPSAGMETLGITKTSVNTTEQDTKEITQHLNQVYTPRQKDIVQHKEEDRMPTILFDDELAQQLEHQFLEEHNQQHPSKDDESTSGNDSIKLSE